MGNKNDAFYIPEKDSAWCYTTDPGTTWEYCDIRDCTPCDQGKYYANNLAPLKTLTASFKILSNQMKFI